MRILHINGVAKSGSTGKIITGICDALHRQGDEAFVAYSGYKEIIADVNYFQINTPIGIKKHQYISFILGDAGFHSNHETYRLINYIDSIKPDIIHLHNVYSYYINVGILLRAIQNRRIPVVWTVHDCWMFTGKCTNFSAVGCEKWKTQCTECPQLNAYPKSLVLDRSSNLYQKKKNLIGKLEKLQLVCVSHWIKSIVQESFLGDRDIQVIYNGVDTSFFRPLNKSEASEMRENYHITDKFLILGVSNVWPVNKGLGDFFELAKYLDETQKIVLIGLSKEQINQAPDNVVALPRTANQEELRQWYSTADVLISFSKEETMGLVVVEAMACGTPVIVPSTTASPELVDDGCGYVNCTGTVDRVLSCIKKIQEKGKQTYSLNCIERVNELFSSKKNYAEYVALYEKILSNEKWNDLKV